MSPFYCQQQRSPAILYSEGTSQSFTTSTGTFPCNHTQHYPPSDCTHCLFPLLLSIPKPFFISHSYSFCFRPYHSSSQVQDKVTHTLKMAGMANVKLLCITTPRGDIQQATPCFTPPVGFTIGQSLHYCLGFVDSVCHYTQTNN